MLKVYGDVSTKWVSFCSRNSQAWSHIVKKSIDKGPDFYKIAKNLVNSAVFEAENTLEVGHDV